MDNWLRQTLLTKTGGFRAAHFTKCRTCHRWILEGPDDHIAAIQARVDPTPLTPAQELECALANRRTYTLGRTPTGKTQIETRCLYAIAAPIHRDVVPAHQCGSRYPSPPRPPTPQDTDTCPF